MRKLISFFQIAGRTGQHEVVNVVCRDECTSSARQWESMVNVVVVRSILALLKSGVTTGSIVATVSLSLQLRLYLLSSEGTLYCLLAGVTGTLIRSMLYAPAFSLAILAVFLVFLFAVIDIVLSIVTQTLFVMCCIIFNTV